jgi:hypothetical protein
MLIRRRRFVVDSGGEPILRFFLVKLLRER